MNRKTVLLLSLIFIVLFSTPGNLYSNDRSFSDFLTLYDYPEVKKSITGRELIEFNKCWKRNGRLVYPDKIIKLYLLASGIIEDNHWKRYLNAFEDLVSKAEHELRTKGALRRINNYNRGEYLLHFLHDNLFKKELKGARSGYNIGIQDTFDEGKFNCYKSSLIYNAMLQYFDFNTSYGSVPNHIYSILVVDNRTVDVETTNRYGFDPLNLGRPQYRRIFDSPNIRFKRTNYRTKTSMDNLHVLVQVYNNRSILFAGEMVYPGTRVVRSLSRAAALSLMGDFLNNGTEDYIIHNTLYKLFMITNENLKINPGALKKEYKRYSAVLEHPRYKSFSERHYRNLEIALSRTLAAIRNRELSMIESDTVSRAYDILTRECINAHRYITRSESIRFAVCNNAMVKYSNILERELPQGRLNNILLYSRQILKMFSLDVMRLDRRIQNIRPRFVSMICARINNLGALAMKNHEWREADRIFTEGIRFLEYEIGDYDTSIMGKMVTNHRTVQKRLNGE